MSDAENYRRIIVARAGGACEYCRLVEAATGVTFHLDHVLPSAVRGTTTLANLALSCPGCNLAKGNRTSGMDSTQTRRELFNPRRYRPSILGWHLNFVLETETGRILTRTPSAEATVLTLDMNSANRLFARRLQIRAGLIS